MLGLHGDPLSKKQQYRLYTFMDPCDFMADVWIFKGKTSESSLACSGGVQCNVQVASASHLHHCNNWICTESIPEYREQKS